MANSYATFAYLNNMNTRLIISTSRSGEIFAARLGWTWSLEGPPHRRAVAPTSELAAPPQEAYRGAINPPKTYCSHSYPVWTTVCTPKDMSKGQEFAESRAGQCVHELMAHDSRHCETVLLVCQLAGCNPGFDGRPRILVDY